MEHQRNDDNVPLQAGQSMNGTRDAHIIDMQRTDDVSPSQGVGDSSVIDPPNVASMSRANSNRRSEVQNRRSRSPLNLRLWIPFELFVTVCQIIALAVVISISRHDKPGIYLYVWAVGYTSGCIAAIPVLCWHFHNIKRMLQQQANQSNLNESSGSPPFEDSSGALNVSSTAEDENHDRVVSTSTSNQANQISRLRISSYMSGALDCFFAVWFLLGNICLFGGYASPVDSPHLYTLCLVFVILSYIGYALPFILCATICCFLPCIIRAIDSENQYQTRGASLETIDALKTFKFKLKRNDNDQDFDKGPKDEQEVLASETDNHEAVREDSACCICLTDFEDGEEMRELPCLHFFHVECIDTWLKVNATCPLCKLELAPSGGELAPSGGESPTTRNSNDHNS